MYDLVALVLLKARYPSHFTVCSLAAFELHLEDEHAIKFCKFVMFYMYYVKYVCTVILVNWQDISVQ